MIDIYGNSLAHGNLYAKMILHRDISVYNILLGDEDDKRLVENRIYGFLIDFDMAIFHDRPIAEISAQVKTVRLSISKREFLD